MLPLSISRAVNRIVSLRTSQRLAAPPRRFASSSSSGSPKYEAPAKSSKHRDFYKTFGLPMTKLFLGAILTYQVLYWSWLKLESMEDKAVNDAEVQRLEAQIGKLKPQASATDSPS